MRAVAVLLVLTSLTACDDRRPGPDAGTAPDGGSGVGDGGVRVDGGARDAGGLVDGGSPTDGGGADTGVGADGGVAGDGGADAGRDAGVDAGTDGGVDAGTPPRADHHIHIDVDNVCRMTVSPTSVTIPAGQTAYFDWHNHSRDYAVDVWMSYGGGYTDLPTGATWDEPVGHCIGPSARTEYADVSTACSSFRFLIHCL